MKKRVVSLKSRRGMSAIIVTLILVLLSIILVGIVWAVVSGIVGSASSQISSQQGCSFSSVEVISFSCTQTGSECNVTLKRDSGSDELGGVRVIFSDNNSNEKTSDFGGNINTLATKRVTAYNIGVANVTKVSAAIYFNDSSGKPSVCRTASTELIGTLGADGVISGGGGSAGSSIYVSGGGSSGGSTGGSSGGTSGGSSGGTTSSSCTSDADCSTGYTCDTTTGTCQCTPTDLSNYCSSQGYSCGTVTAQNGTCGSVTISCGLPLCSFNSGCPTPQYCDLSSHTCQSPVKVNDGTVYSAWPDGAPRFFDSNDLPNTSAGITSLLTSNPNPNGEPYVRFPGSNDANCTPIYLIQYSPTNNRSYAYLYFLSPNDFANISSNDNYEIWNTQYGCLDAAGLSYSTCS